MQVRHSCATGPRHPITRLILIAGALCAMATTAPAADDAGQAALDRLRFTRSFDAIHDKLAADEAAKAGLSTTPAPWTSEALPPPKGAMREVPASAFGATVAHASAGSWREPGDACSMAAGGTVRVLGSASDAGTLVSYRPPATASPVAMEGCADGTVAFIPTVSLFGWPSVGSSLAERREVGARLAAAADRVLSGPDTD
ncbi:hypothetical protein [Lichenibacterium dinghuense]|uniref:hypothetical protein n=1 Tax=Lichenibacterium dinghuense TaxID=2895977 RepID=UPI001F457C81|nr:hypothetical protein [Lichenibacterium sp. 6Y81]